MVTRKRREREEKERERERERKIFSADQDTKINDDHNI